MKLLTYVPSIEPRAIFEYEKLFPDLVWWRKGTLLPYYPYILVSAYYGDQAPHLKKHIEDVLIIGDSGGFQLSKGKPVDPIKILRWQETNCDICIGLDVPPVKDISFEKRLEISKKYHSIMERNRQNYDNIFLKVLHGSSIREISVWYNSFKDINMEGWSIAPKYEPIEIQLAMQFCYLYEQEETNYKWLHIFSISGSKSLIVAFYIKSIVGDKVTFDSSAWANSSKFRRYFSPINYITGDLQIGDRPQSDEKMITLTLDELQEYENETPCLCPVCQKYPPSKYKHVSYRVIALHNFYVLLQWSAFLNFLSKYRKKFREWIKFSVNNTHVLEAIRLIDLQLEYGFDRVAKEVSKFYANKFKGKKTKYGQITLI